MPCVMIFRKQKALDKNRKLLPQPSRDTLFLLIKISFHYTQDIY